jgi:RNA polymerase sigma factor (sigma-70 family)
VGIGRSRSARGAQVRDAYRDNVKAVYAYFAYSVPADVAEDLTAATFERVVRSWHTFDARRGKLRTWILAIARNVLADHFRTMRLERSVSLDEYPELAAHAGASADPLALREELEALTAWLSVLDDRQREVLALRYGADLKPAEIAAHLELSEANVYQILSRGLRRLREEMGTDQPHRSARLSARHAASSSGLRADRTP